jgi:hypothetical protein
VVTAASVSCVRHTLMNTCCDVPCMVCRFVPDGDGSDVGKGERIFRGLVVMQLCKKDCHVRLHPRLRYTLTLTNQKPHHQIDIPSPNNIHTNPVVALRLLALNAAANTILTHSRTLPQPAPVEGMPDLLIGSLGAAYNERMLRLHRITHILTIGVHIRPKFPDAFTYKVVEGEHIVPRERGSVLVSGGNKP